MIESQMKSLQLYLASSSPRRAQLLEQIGVRFEIVQPDIIEEPEAGERAEELPLRLAITKARKGEAIVGDRKPVGDHKPVLGADTIVLLQDRILGKPGSREEALNTLSELSGKTHRVISAVAICHRDRLETAVCETLVQFRDLTREEQISYCNTEEPMDKAGAYGIQGLGAILIESIKGSYSGVMGLPLMETSRLLSTFNIECLGN
jgi:septum formation protein